MYLQAENVTQKKNVHAICRDTYIFILLWTLFLMFIIPPLYVVSYAVPAGGHLSLKKITENMVMQRTPAVVI